MAGSIASYIDHTDLRPQATRQEIENLCGEARRYGFAAVCVNLSRAQAASLALAGTGVRLAVVAGFPLGATTAAVKVYEARAAAAAGADEIDLVIDIGALKDGDCRLVEEEIRAVVNAVAPVAVKAILETCYLSDDEIIAACRASVRAGAAFVKTSTGFGPAGASLEQVRLMRSVVGSAAGVKASGGIRTYRDARAMIEAGADRIGTSSGVRIVMEEGGDPDHGGDPDGVAGKR
jgi:deoxyribose-phosphate aldolase